MRSFERRLMGLGLAVAMVGCSGSEGVPAERPSPPRSVAAVTASAFPPDVGVDPGPAPIPTTVRTSSGFEVSPDGAHVATPATDPLERKGISIHRLEGERAGSVARFFELGKAQVEFWLDAEHVVATTPKTLWLLDVSSGEAQKFEGLHSPLATKDRARVIAIDTDTRPVILEAPTLTKRVTVDAMLGEEPFIRLEGGGTVILAAGTARSVVASLEGKVRLDLPIGSFLDDRSGVSPRGGYVTRLVPGEGVAMLALFEIATGKEIYRADGAFYPGAIVVSPDESYAVASNEPGSGVHISLPSGKLRALSGSKWESEGYSYITRSLGVTADGAFVCGIPVTSIGKYTNCNHEILFSLGRKPKPKGAHVGCHVEDGVATIVSIPKASIGAQRHAIPSASATYTRLCNSSISVDRSLIGLAVVPDAQPKDAYQYDAADLLLLRVADGSVEASFELGPGPSSMGAVLNHSFSPSGRFVRVEWKESSVRIFDRRTGKSIDNVFDFEPTDTVFVSGETGLLIADSGERVALALMEKSVLYPRHPL